MTETKKVRSEHEVQILAGFYGGKFEDAMNVLFSPANIAGTAAKIIELEKTLGPFEVGKFNKYLLPADIWPDIDGKKTDATAFEMDYFKIPDALRMCLSEIISANLHSANPLPIFYRTSDNVDKSHDIVVKPFVYKGTMYIGVLYLCPNRKSPPQP